MTIVDNSSNSNVESNRVYGQTVQFNTDSTINETIEQNLPWQVNVSSNGGNNHQGLILMQQGINQSGSRGGGGETPQQIVGIGSGGIVTSTGQIGYDGRTETPGGIGGRTNEMGGGERVIMVESPVGKFIQNRGNIPTKFYGNNNKKSVNVIGQQLLQERSFNETFFNNFIKCKKNKLINLWE